MSTQTIRQSTILISAGRKTNVYSSLDQVPEGLKRKLIRSTSGTNSATILLADRAGREEIVRALRGLPSPVQARLAVPKIPWTEALTRRQAAPLLPEPPHVPLGVRLQEARNWAEFREDARHWMRAHWPELLLPVGVAIGLWALLAS